MKNSPAKMIIVVIGAAALIGTLFLFIPNATGQSYDKGAVVKLYSGNELVGTWTAVSLGHADGYTYTFNVGSTTSPTEVKICGTYSVERIP